MIQISHSVSFQMSNIHSKIGKHMKKQSQMSSNLQKNKPTDSDPKIIQALELFMTDFKTGIINVFKDIKKNIDIVTERIGNFCKEL